MEQISIFRFGEFTLDGAQRRLLRAGQDVYLPPKTFELLLYLASEQGTRHLEGRASRGRLARRERRGKHAGPADS